MDSSSFSLSEGILLRFVGCYCWSFFLFCSCWVGILSNKALKICKIELWGGESLLREALKLLEIEGFIFLRSSACKRWYHDLIKPKAQSLKSRRGDHSSRALKFLLWIRRKFWCRFCFQRLLCELFPKFCMVDLPFNNKV